MWCKKNPSKDMVIPQFLLVSLLYHKWIMVAKFGNNENFKIKSLTLLIRIVIIKKIEGG